MHTKDRFDPVVRGHILKRIRGQEYIDNVLGPAADGIVDAIADAYEQMGACFGEFELYKAQGRLLGLKESLTIIREIARNSQGSDLEEN